MSSYITDMLVHQGAARRRTHTASSCSSDSEYDETDIANPCVDAGSTAVQDGYQWIAIVYLLPSVVTVSPGDVAGWRHLGLLVFFFFFFFLFAVHLYFLLFFTFTVHY